MSGAFLYGTVEAIALHRAAAITADANGTAVDLETLDSSGRKGIARLTVGTVTASDTLDVKIQGRAGSTGTWSDIVSFPQIAAAGEETIEFNDLKEHRYVRVALNVTGSSVSIVASVDLILNRPIRV